MPEFSTRVVGEFFEIVNLELQNPTTVLPVLLKY